MKHEERTRNTRMMMAASLKKLMNEKPFSKITVTDIAKDCDIDRKTFYYHFSDIYALLKWMFNEEAVNIVAHFDLITEYEDAILFVMDYVEENDYIINCVFDSIGLDETRRFFYNDFLSLTKKLINEIADYWSLTVDEAFVNFLSDFYAGGLANLLINWVNNTSCYTREEVINNISMIFRDTIQNILRKKSEESHPI